MIRRGTWLAAALAFGLALAGPVTPAYAAERGSTGFGRIWEWLTAVLAWQPTDSASSDQCGMIDPDGRCIAGASANSDQCSSIDPDGRCIAGTSGSSDQCLSIDPDGRCITGTSASSDQCGMIDPNG